MSREPFLSWATTHPGARRPLADAIAAAQAGLRKAPMNLDARVLLAKLLIFGGNRERADTLMDAATAIDPTTSLVVAKFRQLLHAETARRKRCCVFTIIATRGTCAPRSTH